jgi:hypothetical protein
MYAVYFKKGWAERFRPSKFCGSLFQLCVVSYELFEKAYCFNLFADWFPLMVVATMHEEKYSLPV